MSDKVISKSTLNEFCQTLEEMSNTHNLEEKFRHSIKTLRLKVHSMSESIPSNHLENEMKSFNIPHLNKTLTNIATFVKSNNSESDISSQALSIINSLSNHAKRNKNTKLDAYLRTTKNNRIYNSNTLFSTNTTNTTNNSNNHNPTGTEILTDFSSIREKLQKQKEKQQKNISSANMSEKEWAGYIFGNNEVNNTTIPQVSNTNKPENRNNIKIAIVGSNDTHKPPSYIQKVQTINDIQINKIKRSPKPKSKKSKPTKQKYGSYKPVDAFQKCQWETLIAGGKKPSQIAVAAAGQACGFTEGFTHADILKHTNSILNVSFTKTATLDVKNSSFLDNQQKNSSGRKLIKVTNKGIVGHIKQVMTKQVKDYFEQLLKNKQNKKQSTATQANSNEINEKNSKHINDNENTNTKDNEITQFDDVYGLDPKYSAAFTYLQNLLDDEQLFFYFMDLLHEISYEFNETNVSQKINEICKSIENVAFDHCGSGDDNNKTFMLKNELDSMKAKYDSICDENDKLNDDNDKYADDYYRLKRKYKDMKDELNEMKQKLKRKRKEIRNLKSSNTRTRSRTTSRSRSRNRKYK